MKSVGSSGNSWLTTLCSRTFLLILYTTTRVHLTNRARLISCSPFYALPSVALPTWNDHSPLLLQAEILSASRTSLNATSSRKSVWFLRPRTNFPSLCSPSTFLLILLCSFPILLFIIIMHVPNGHPNRSEIPVG